MRAVRVMLVAAMSMAALLTQSVSAQVSGTWTANAAGMYSLGTNWSSNPMIPDAGGVATFGSVITASRIITLDTSPTLSGIVFSHQASPGVYTINPATTEVFNMTAGSTITNNGLGATISAGLSLAGGLTFNGSGPSNLTISGPVTGALGTILINTTPPIIESAQVILGNAGNNFAGGSVTLQSGNLQLTNPAALGAPANTLNITGPSTQLLAGAALVTLANNVNLNGGPLNVGGTNSFTMTGAINNAVGDNNGVTVLLRTTTTGLSLQGANGYTGPTVIRPSPFTTAGVSNTNLNFSGAAGSALNSSSFNATAATISLDNTGVPFISRVSPTMPIFLGTGNFRLVGGTDAGDVTQNVGAITGNGGSSINVIAGTGGITLASTQLNRSSGATFLLTGGTNFGGGAGLTNMTFGNLAPLPGLNTTAAQIVPFAIGDAGTGTLNGTNFVTYDANGIRLLNASETTASLTAGQNARITAAAANNTAALPLNSLAMVGATSGSANITGSGSLNLSGPILAVNTGAVTVQHTILQPVNFGSNEGLLFAPTANSGASTVLSIQAPISGTAGLNMSGTGTASIYFFTATNTYTGPTTINKTSVQFTDPSAFGPSTTPITFNGVMGSGFGGIGYGVQAAADMNRDFVINHGQMTVSALQSGGVLIFNGAISGDGGIVTNAFGATTVAGARYILAGVNTSSYTTRIFSTANLEFANDANLGTSDYMTISAGNSLFGAVLAGNWTTNKNLVITGASRINTNGFNAIVNGTVSNTSALTKSGNGDLNLTALNGFSGGLTVIGGSVTLSGQGRLDNYTTTTVSGGRLVLDNSTTGISNRISTGGTISMSATSGELNIIAGANNIVESPASISIGGGGGNATVRMSASTGSVLFTPTALTESNARSLLVAGTGLANSALATVPGTTGMRMTTLPTLVGGGGASGSNTISILPGGFGDTNPLGFGEGLITHINGGGNTVGIRLLDASEYVNNAFSATTANSRINTPTTSAITQTINSLWMDGANVTIASGTTLTNTSGTLLATGGNSLLLTGDGVNGGGGILESGGTVANQVRGLIVNTVTDVTSNVVINSTSTVAGWRMVKIGPGTLTLDPRNAAGATTTGVTGTNTTSLNIYGGTVTLPVGQNITAIGGLNLVMTNDARFRFLGNGTQTSRTVTVPGGNGRLDLTGTALQLTATGAALAGNGQLILEGGTLVLGANTQAAPSGSAQASTIDGGITVGGGATLAINADSTATTGPLGNPAGVLALNGGSTLATRFATRTVQNSVFVNGDVNFANNLTVNLPFIGGTITDTSNAGLTISPPTRLNGSATVTNSMTGPSTTRLTFAGGFYDNPFIAPSTLTLANTGGASETVLAGPSVHRGGTTIASGSVIVSNTLGSATGRGNVIVNAGARLAGGNSTGTAGFVYPNTGGSVTVNGTLEAGNGLTSVGIMTIGSTISDHTTALSGVGSRFVFNLAATNLGSLTPVLDGSSTTTVGVGNNLVRGLGLSAATSMSILPETLVVNSTPGLANWDPNQNYSWLVATLSTGTLNSWSPAPSPIVDTANFNNALVGGFYFFQNGQSLYVNYTPVPEPATVLGICALGFGAARVIRRRFKKTTTAV